MSAITATPAPGASERPDILKVWFQAVRFFSFTASAIPIFVGSALALVWQSFDWVLFLAMAIASIACHAGANLANDYFDHTKGVDNDDSLGPSKVIQLGYLSAQQVLHGAIVAFSLATVLGLYIVYRTGWEVLALALASLGAAIFYTGGPKPLGYVALGELTVFLAMGVGMVMGAFYVHTGMVNWESFLLSLPISGLVAAILHVNNIRDIDFDRHAGKLTTANMLGRAWANREYAVLVGLAYVAVLALVAYERSLWPVLISLITMRVAIELIRIVNSDSGPGELNLALRRTAGLHMSVGLLITTGLIVRTIIDRYV
ncbi:MAG: 1,4-dihydroxy-2-naphthoate octaprenyltransferase [Thermomicrobiales bacterium]